MTEKEFMPWCDEHWQKLRDCVRERSMEHLVPIGGQAAAEQMRKEMAYGSSRDAEGFDPLLRAWAMINERALKVEADPFKCPLCWLVEGRNRHVDLTHCDDPTCSWTNADSDPNEWLKGCTDSLLEHAKKLGLVQLA